jgi:D-glycero-D-manno-heptose 1,7-bisphosphate phosphatase
MTAKKNPAVFLDRDGTICEEVGYLDSVDRFRLLPRSSAAIKILNEQGFKAVVITNQSGVARGYFSESRLKEIHRELERRLREDGASLDAIYYCPHHPLEGEPPYRLVCECRKPNPGLVLQAAKELDIDLPASYAIGDRFADLACGQRVGAKGVLVLTGYGKEEIQSGIEKCEPPPAFIADDLYEAVQWIIRDGKKS